MTATTPCTCNRISCVCEILREHADGCRFRTSATCAVGVECDHGFDVCADCDPCTCTPPRPRNLGGGRTLDALREKSQ